MKKYFLTKVLLKKLFLNNKLFPKLVKVKRVYFKIIVTKVYGRDAERIGQVRLSADA